MFASLLLKAFLLNLCNASMAGLTSTFMWVPTDYQLLRTFESKDSTKQSSEFRPCYVYVCFTATKFHLTLFWCCLDVDHVDLYWKCSQVIRHTGIRDMICDAFVKHQRQFDFCTFDGETIGGSSLGHSHEETTQPGSWWQTQCWCGSWDFKPNIAWFIVCTYSRVYRCFTFNLAAFRLRWWSSIILFLYDTFH